MRKIQRALVSGVTGFIGSALASRLIESGCEVFGLVRSGSARRRLSRLPQLNMIEYDESSAELPDAIVQECRPDVIFNLAAHGVQAGANDVDPMLRCNVDLTVQLLRAAAQVPDCRFIHTGSCFEYGRTVTAQHMTEDFPTQPFSPYGATKLASVHLVRTLAPQLGVPSAILRPFAVYGPGDAPERLLPRLLTALRSGQPLDLTAGEQRRDWLHIDDVVEAFACVGRLDTDALNGTIFNVCSATPTSVRHFGETLVRLAGAPSELLCWDRLPYRSQEPMWIVGSNYRLCTTTDWRPRYTLEQGLEHCLQADLNGLLTRPVVRPIALAA